MAQVKLELLNGPLECGLRTLSILAELYPKSADLNELVMLDYMLVHSGDVPNGPPSLHPPSPLRSGEVAIRRRIIQEGLVLFQSRHLIVQTLTERGFEYMADDLAPAFLDVLQSPYQTGVRDRARWVVGVGRDLGWTEFARVFDDSLVRWRAEFAVLAGDELTTGEL